MTYNQIVDTVSIMQTATSYAENANFKKVEELFNTFIAELLLQHQDPDHVIMIYNAALAALDSTKDKTTHDNIIARHARVLRNFCATHRNEVHMQPDEINDLAKTHLTSTPNFASVKLAGIRKTIRTTQNLGIISPYLVDQEPERAIVAGCAWAAISPRQVIDAGFICLYGNKFDVQRTMSIIDIDTYNDPSGLTLDEFQIFIRILIEKCIEQYETATASQLIRYIAINTINKIMAVSGQAGLDKIINFAKKYLNLNLATLSNVQELLPFVLMSKTNLFAQANKIPQNACIHYGLELLYPIAPLLSQEWVSEVNKLIEDDFRLGFVDNNALYHAKYNGYNQHTRFLPYVSCSFLVSADQESSDKIAAASNSKLLSTAYVWQGSDTQSRYKIEFNIDDLLIKKVFPEKGTFVIKPKATHMCDQPHISSTYHVVENNTAADALPAMPNDIVFIVNTRTAENVSVWGTSLTNSQAQAILPYLDFVPGQEQDSSQDIIVCKVDAEPNNNVSNALLSNRHNKFVFIKSKDRWQE